MSSRSTIIKHFGYKHLPPEQQAVSEQIYALAVAMDKTLPSGQEKEAGLRKLLEAMDCFGRSARDINPG